MTSYSNDESDSSSVFDFDSLLDSIDNDTNDKSWLFDDKIKHPPEHYLAEAEELDVQRLWQRRYSPNTQVQLDRVKLQYCSYIKKDPVQCFRDVTIRFLKGFLSWVGKKIDEMIIRQGQDLIKFVADQKGLDNSKRESATMYAEDLAEFSRVLLTTTQMTFAIGWLRIQQILFSQLAGITGN
ncbi:hypothetical protein V490_06472 [Pseudogymnoascus sp. VKM F-3557]|nr:hypothetical protein V490_06472 [Pseudogymnoascus sp. VKM F-3557]